MPKLPTQFFILLLLLTNVPVSVLSAALPVNPGESCSVPAACGVRKEEKPPCQGLRGGKLGIYPYLRNFLPPAKGGEVFSACYRSIFCSRYSTFLNVQFSNFLMFFCQKICIPHSEGSCATVCKQLRGQLSLILILKYMEFSLDGEGKGTKLNAWILPFSFFPSSFSC